MHINKVAVAGATGFVGTAIIDSLLKNIVLEDLQGQKEKYLKLLKMIRLSGHTVMFTLRIQ